MIVSLLNTFALTLLLLNVKCDSGLIRGRNVQVVVQHNSAHHTRWCSMSRLQSDSVLTSEFISHIISGDVLVHLSREVVPS